MILKRGEDYLVYANPSSMYGNKEQLVTIICDRTTVLAQAEEDLAILGEGKIPLKQVDLTKEFNRLSLGTWVSVLGIVLIVVLAFLIWRRVRKLRS